MLFSCFAILFENIISDNKNKIISNEINISASFNKAILLWLLWGNAKTNGRKPKSCFRRVFNFKFGCFVYEYNCEVLTNTATFKVENSAQVLSC
jgi:hypothetical protein